MAMSARLKTIGAAVAVTVAGVAIGAHGWSMASNHAGLQPTQPSPAPSTVTAAGITLHSVSVGLPSSERMFPGGADAEAINNNCLACHSAGMVLTQPGLSRGIWQQEVEKMRAQYKAPVDEADVPAIVAYLAEHKGVEVDRPDHRARAGWSFQPDTPKMTEQVLQFRPICCRAEAASGSNSILVRRCSASPVPNSTTSTPGSCRT